MRATSVPPHDTDAEQSVLGAIMLDRGSVERVVGSLKVEDFYSEAHRIIYEAALEHYMKETPIEPKALKATLEGKGLIDRAGGASYLHTLVAQAVSATTIGHYAKIVKEASYLRGLIKITTEAASLAYDKPEEPKRLSERVQTLLYDLDMKENPANQLTFREIMRACFEEIEEAKEGRMGGIRIGVPSIDRLLTGLYPGDLVLIAARPAMGKTALALNILINIASKQVPAAVFSLEMSKEQLMQRIYCQTAKIDSFKLRSGNLGDEHWAKLSNAIGRLAELPILIDDNPSATVLDIKAKSREFFRGHVSPGVIIVDYLQLMDAVKAKDNRQAEVSEISRGLKITAKELGVPIIALSQLSRASELRPNKTPQLSDLRDSGSLEQDADIIMFIHRNVASEIEAERSQAKIIIGKHRKGPCGTVDVKYDEHFTRFYEVDSRYGDTSR